MMTDEEKIIQLYKEMYSAMINKDKAELERVHDDSFVLYHMTVMKQPKHEYISAIMSGMLNYYSAAQGDMEVTINGDTARLTGKSRSRRRCLAEESILGDYSSILNLYGKTASGVLRLQVLQLIKEMRLWNM